MPLLTAEGVGLDDHWTSLTTQTILGVYDLTQPELLQAYFICMYISTPG